LFGQTAFGVFRGVGAKEADSAAAFNIKGVTVNDAGDLGFGDFGFGCKLGQKGFNDKVKVKNKRDS